LLSIVLLAQQIAQLQQHQCCLLFTALDRHKAHPRPAHRLADRFGVDRVVFAAFDIGLDVLRWDQHDLMPQPAQHPPPVVRSAARLQPDPRRRQLDKKLLYLRPSQLPAQHRPLLLINPVHLKDALGCIQPDPDNRHRTAPLAVVLTTRSLAHSMPSGAVHPNRNTGVGKRMVG
jgi:hypothetical protein